MYLRSNPKKIAYILGTFPYPTTTFIDREIVEAKRKGVNIILLAIRHPLPFEMTPEVKRLADETNYILPVSWLRFVWSNLHYAITRPWVYLGTFCYLLTRKHDTLLSRIKTLFHFAEGIRATDLLQRECVDHIHAHFADRAAIVAMVASRLLGLPYSLTAHANDIYVSPVMLQEKIAGARFTVTCTAYNKEHSFLWIKS